MKYSSTVRPSMKLALIGRSMISPFGLAMRPRMPASWRIWLIEPRAPDVAIIMIGFVASKCFCIAPATSSVASVHFSTPSSWRPACRVGPPPPHGLVAPLLRDQAHVGLVLDLGDLGLVAAEDLPLLRRDHD